MTDFETIEAEATEVDALPPAVIEQHQSVNLFGDAAPASVIEKATEAADALAAVIEQKQLYALIQQRKHVNVEGWTLLGSMLGVFPVIEWSRPTDDGWEARATAQTRSGEVIGAAEAMCSRREKAWKNRDDYALRSMAQTRAVSKALRHPLGFIMTLAGYEATPEAEIPKEEARPAQASQARDASPETWDDVRDLLMAYGDGGTTYEIFGRFGASARKRIFGDDDLSAAKKKELFDIAAAAAVTLITEVDPAKFPPPSEEDIATAWAKQLDGEMLAPAPKEGSNE